jgi:hypothetical protein
VKSARRLPAEGRGTDSPWFEGQRCRDEGWGQRWGDLLSPTTPWKGNEPSERVVPQDWYRKTVHLSGVMYNVLMESSRCSLEARLVVYMRQSSHRLVTDWTGKTQSGRKKEGQNQRLKAEVPREETKCQTGEQNLG